MKPFFTLTLLLGLSLTLFSQTNILVTNPEAEAILLGNYSPQDYLPSQLIDNPQQIIAELEPAINPDSLKSYLFALRSFVTRHTSSDTISADTGIGAARQWVFQKMEAFSSDSENRLITSYLQFDRNICDVNRHKNVFTVLPGLDTTDNAIILIEAHMDSRCESVCDADCIAEGMEDNGSGTALVLELARIMSRFAFDHTIVFMATTGEEQGLYGADAFSDWVESMDVPVKAVLNNDVIGGIICGETSSEPSCPGLNHIDSTQVRLFSYGGFNSRNKQLSRFIKLQYEEELEPMVAVPQLLTIMSSEDRQGRGGDHIPFRQKGYPAMRFTSANEHGNANTSDPDYHDRQHTVNDILGLDTDGDNLIDSFFVDFNYLARNAAINGNAAIMAALGPETPDFEANRIGDDIRVIIDDPENYGEYRIFFRSQTNDFDTIFTLSGQTEVYIPKPPGVVYVSVASVDDNSVESLFSGEVLPLPIVGTENPQPEEKDEKKVKLLQNRPNPFDESTIISFWVESPMPYQNAYIGIFDLNGQVLKKLSTQVQKGMNEVVYFHGYNTVGTFIYSLIIDEKVIDSKRMIFAN
jgi:hypothetical protein